MSDTTTFGSENDRLEKLSDWLQSTADDLSDRLGAVLLEVRSESSDWVGAAADPLRAALNRCDASGHNLLEVLQSVVEALRRLTVDLAVQDHSAALSLLGL